AMPLPQELLALARELVDRNPAAPLQGDLRRGVSTAYYALFHLLVQEATTRLVAIAALQPRIALAFDHKIMRFVCQDYVKPSPNPAGQLLMSGQTVPQELQAIALSFIALQQARALADYDTAATITQADAQFEVKRAEDAFQDWAAVQADP